MTPTRFRNRLICCLGFLSLGLSLTLSPSAFAIPFTHGDIQGNIDTTLSLGIQYRLNNPAADLVGIANGGQAFSVNYDDGNLNYPKGVSSLAGKMLTELELRYLNYGAFVRLNAFYDYENKKRDRARTPLSDIALKRVGSRVEFLDYFAFAFFDVGSVTVDLRAGNQVINWGESTFVQGGVNVVNPIDVSKLRLPGSELREALLPVPLVSANLGLTPTISIEVFYQLKWKEIIIDPVGSFFGTNDFVAEGGERLFLGFGLVPEYDTATPPLPVSHYRVPRAPDRYPRNRGQFGIALHWVVPQLNETEFGFYYVNYHSRLPYISGQAGTLQGVLTGNYPGSARYYVVYPRHIDLFAASFSSVLGRTGIAIQGELSYRPDMPFQVDDVELLFTALSAPSALLPSNPTNPALQGAFFLGQNSQLGVARFQEEIQGYRFMDFWQGQVTLTKVFGPTWNADQWVLLGEFAFNYADLPDASVLRFDGPATYTSANPVFTQAGIQPATANPNNFATKKSWGYRLVTRWDFNNVFAGVNVSPLLAFNHDVAGITPLPVGNFLRHRKSLTLGVDLTYQSAYQLELRWAEFWGGNETNLVRDRDFVSATIKYSF